MLQQFANFVCRCEPLSRVFRQQSFDDSYEPGRQIGSVGRHRYGLLIDDPPQQVLDRIKAIVDEELEKLRSAAPDPRELERAKNGIETQFLGQMEVVAAKADQLNSYFTNTGNPDYFGEDIGRYLVLEPNDVQAAVRRWLPKDKRLEISVIPGVKK